MQKNVLILVGSALLLTMAWRAFLREEGDVAARDNPKQQIPKAAPPPGASGTNLPAPSVTASSTARGAATRTAALAGATEPADLARRIDAIFAIANEIDRKAAFDRLIAETSDLASLRAIVEAMNRLYKSGRRLSQWDDFWRIIAHRDPKLAIDLLESYGPDQSWYASVVNRIVGEWASSDPQAAMVWLNANKALSNEELDHAAISLIHGYASHNALAATQYALSVFQPTDRRFGDLGWSLSTQAMRQGGVEGLRAWFRSLPDDAIKQRWFNSVSARLGEFDPNHQRAWLESEARSSYRNDQSYRDSITAMAKTDPKGALLYAFSQPDSPHRPGVHMGVGGASFNWLQQDPAGFADYYHGLQSAFHREAILKALRDGLGDKNLPTKSRRPATEFLDSLTRSPPSP